MQYEKLEGMTDEGLDACKERVRQIEEQLAPIIRKIQIQKLKTRGISLSNMVERKYHPWEDQPNLQDLEEALASVREQIEALELEGPISKKREIPHGLAKGRRMANLALEHAQSQAASIEARRNAPKPQRQQTSNTKSEKASRWQAGRTDMKKQESLERFEDGEIVETIKDASQRPVFNIVVRKPRYSGDHSGFEIVSISRDFPVSSLNGTIVGSLDTARNLAEQDIASRRGNRVLRRQEEGEDGRYTTTSKDSSAQVSQDMLDHFRRWRKGETN